MNITRMAAVGTAGLLSAAVLAGGPAGAQEGGEFAPLTVDPTSGPAGTVISVSGADCVEEGVATVSSAILVRFDDSETEDDLLDIADVDAAEDGTWATSLTMPAGLDPEGVYLVTAACLVAESEQLVVDYEVVEFDLTGAAPTEPPADTPPAAPAPAAAATPVRAQPTFTG